MNIYVGNLAYTITNQDLKEIFKEFGDVKNASIIMDRETNRSKGFAFVEMYKKEDGAKAIEELNGASVDGRDLQINEARPRPERPARR